MCSSQFSPGFDVQVFHSQVFQRVFGFQRVLGVSRIFGQAFYFSRCVSKLAFALGFMRFGFWVRLHLGRKQAKQQAVQQHLGVSSQFVFGLEEKEYNGREVEIEAR